MGCICKCARADVLLPRILETAGRITLKFGVWLETHYVGILEKSRVGCICTSARADVPTFPHLGNSQTDCAKIWYVVRDPLAGRFTEA